LKNVHLEFHEKSVDSVLKLGVLQKTEDGGTKSQLQGATLPFTKIIHESLNE